MLPLIPLKSQVDDPRNIRRVKRAAIDAEVIHGALGVGARIMAQQEVAARMIADNAAAGNRIDVGAVDPVTERVALDLYHNVMPAGRDRAFGFQVDARDIAQFILHLKPRPIACRARIPGLTGPNKVRTSRAEDSDLCHRPLAFGEAPPEGYRPIVTGAENVIEDRAAMDPVVHAVELERSPHRARNRVGVGVRIAAGVEESLMPLARSGVADRVNSDN